MKIFVELTFKRPLLITGCSIRTRRKQRVGIHKSRVILGFNATVVAQCNYYRKKRIVNFFYLFTGNELRLDKYYNAV